MQRYQIYLEPESVNVLDELAKLTNFSRSQIIRDVINKMAREYEKIIETNKKKTKKQSPLKDGRSCQRWRSWSFSKSG